MLLQDFRLKVFVTVAEEKSFTKAANLLDVSQPAVSQNVAELEKGLGVRLFDRLKGEVALTREGAILLRYAHKSLEHSELVECVFASVSPQTVRVSSSDDLYSYYVGPRLRDLAAVHPEISFVRAGTEDADVAFSLRPSSGVPFGSDSETVLRLRVSASLPPKDMGDISAAHEVSSYFDVILRPTPSFAGTGVFRIMKSYFASLL